MAHDASPATPGAPPDQAGNVRGGRCRSGSEYTFLLFLRALLIAGLFALAALRTYPRDVATAVASETAIGEAAGHGGEVEQSAA